MSRDWRQECLEALADLERVGNDPVAIKRCLDVVVPLLEKRGNEMWVDQVTKLLQAGNPERAARLVRDIPSRVQRLMVPGIVVGFIVVIVGAQFGIRALIDAKVRREQAAARANASGPPAWVANQTAQPSLSSRLTDLVAGFASDLAGGRIDAARARLGQVERAALPEGRLREIGQNAYLVGVQGVDIWRTREVGGTVVAEGVLKTPKGNARLTVDAVFEGPELRISGLSISGSPLWPPGGR